jgi:hypothetical protein
MLSRRALIAGLVFVVTQAGLLATQQKPQQPREEALKTVTLIIDGMT